MEHTALMYIHTETRRTRYFICKGFHFSESEYRSPCFTSESRENFLNDLMEYSTSSYWLDEVALLKRLGNQVCFIQLYDDEFALPNFKYLVYQRSSMKLVAVFDKPNKADQLARDLNKETCSRHYVERITEDRFLNGQY